MSLLGCMAFLFFVVFASLLRRREPHTPHSLWRRVLFAFGLGGISTGLIVTSPSLPPRAEAAASDGGADGGVPSIPQERTGEVLVHDPRQAVADAPVMAVECTKQADPLIGLCRVRDNRL